MDSTEFPALPACFKHGEFSAVPSQSDRVRKRKLLVIYNPTAGSRQAKQWVTVDLPKILAERYLLDADNCVCVELVSMECTGHAYSLVKQASKDNVDGICIYGGDGSMHEIVNGLLDRPDGASIPIGLIPGGTGNAFAADLECSDRTEALMRILRGRTHPVDAMYVEYGSKREHVWAFNVGIQKNKVAWWFFEHFLGGSIVHFGLTVAINRQAEYWRWMGQLRYNLAAMYGILRGYLEHRVEFLVGGKPYQPPEPDAPDSATANHQYALIFAQNTKHTGKETPVAPRAALDDGQIDLLVAWKPVSRWRALDVLLKMFDGKHLETGLISYTHCSSKLELRNLPGSEYAAEGEPVLMVDGENMGSLPVSIEIKKHAFRIFV